MIHKAPKSQKESGRIHSYNYAPYMRVIEITILCKLFNLKS